MRTICIARETGGASTLGTAREESRHGPFSSGCCMGAGGGYWDGGPCGGGICATVFKRVVRKSVANASMVAVFA